MEEMRVYLVNLHKYNEGNPVGDWFTCPLNIEDVNERLKLGNNHEEYAIHDYELPFTISEYENLENINRLSKMAQELDGTPIAYEIKEITNRFFNSFEEMCEHSNDIRCYPDCVTMTDLAYYFINTECIYGSVSSTLQNYIDYDYYGRDLEISGNFLVTNHGVFEYKS